MNTFEPNVLEHPNSRDKWEERRAKRQDDGGDGEEVKMTAELLNCNQVATNEPIERYDGSAIIWVEKTKKKTRQMVWC